MSPDEALDYTLTITNTGNIDFTDISVPLTGGNGGTIGTPSCKVNGQGEEVSINGALEVGTFLECKVTYTTIQEDLEVGSVTLSARGTATAANTSSPSVVTTAADQRLSVVLAESGVSVSEGKAMYNAVGKSSMVVSGWVMLMSFIWLLLVLELACNTLDRLTGDCLQTAD
jgi:hypothetical protein